MSVLLNFIFFLFSVDRNLSKACTLPVLHKSHINWTANEDKTFPFYMTPIFRKHLALFFRVTENPLQVLYYKIQIVVLKWRDIRHKTTKKFLLARACAYPRRFVLNIITVILIDTIWCQCSQFVNPMTLFFPQFFIPFDKVCQLYAFVLQSSMPGTAEMAINQLVFFVLALCQTFMGIDPVLVADESGSKFSYSRSYILDLALFTVDYIYYVTRVAV